MSADVGHVSPVGQLGEVMPKLGRASSLGLIWVMAYEKQPGTSDGCYGGHLHQIKKLSFVTCGVRDFPRIFITGCPNWDFKNSGCPPSTG